MSRPSKKLLEIEFRSPEDEAWYAVNVLEKRDCLVVTFKDLSRKYDESYSTKDFKSFDEIKEFEKRFRAVSIQMQDKDCPKLSVGTIVCATCPLDNGDVKYFDAYVVKVERLNHDRDHKGEEVCGCDFKLYWFEGPNAKEVTSAKVGDICLRQNHDRMNPKVVSFLEKVKKAA